MIKNQSLGGWAVGLVAALFVAASSVLMAPSASQADVFFYPNVSGTTVDFTSITENNHEVGNPLPFFGAPTAVVGDFLDFTPINFAVNATGPGFDSKDSLISFMSKAKPGYSIQNISFVEGGGLGALGAGTDNTFVDVSAIGFINVLEIDGAPLPPNTAVPQIPINLTFSFGSVDNGTWYRGADGFTNLTAWTGSQAINISQELSLLGIPFVSGATKITVSLDNALYAQAEAGAGARIDKKDFFTVLVNVPEPTSCLLAFVGMAFGLVSIRRSR